MYGPELSQGSTIANRYILKEYKGSGSFGEVWLAEDSELGIDVAIKLYISLDQKGQDEFKDEYKVAYGLSHENLLTAQYYGVWDHRPYLIMKYCSRGSAGNIGGIVNEADIWKFIHDVANGLKYLHGLETPIVHQDIKPENILIDEQGNYLITDFGISKKMRTTMRKQSKRAIESGAIAYMGPERFLKDPMAVKASDIWSLGVSIYELATNDLPFMGQGGGMLNAGAALPELDPQKWSANLTEIMQACLAKETWDRPTAEELAEYSQQILKGKDISWHKWKAGETEQPVVAEESKSSKKWIIFTAIGAVILTLACVFIFGGPSAAEEERQQVEHRYASLMSMCQNDISVGNAQNYTSLLAAKSLMDSLFHYQSAYSYISEEPKYRTGELQSSLDDKLTEAQEAWMRSASGQVEVADDYSTAIQYYHIAASIKDSPAITQALANIASRTGCQGAYMAVSKVKILGNYLEINYTGLNSSPISGVTMVYELTNSAGGDVIRGQANIDIAPGENHTITISPNGTIDGQTHLTLSVNNVEFYNSTIEN